MWSKLGIFIAVFGLTHRVYCADIPYSDMYLPGETNGFVCETDNFTIDHLREVVKRIMELTFFEKYYQKFPKLFEDTHLFNVKSDILLSWPVLPNQKFHSSNPGRIRLIINIRGQIMGMVIVNPKERKKKVTFEKCNPVRRFIEEASNELQISDENLGMSRPVLGFKCGLKVVPWSNIDRITEFFSDDSFRKRLKEKNYLANLKKYTGDDFVGVDLYYFPVHKKLSNRITFVTTSQFWLVFDMSNNKFKGIVNLHDRNDKCVALWDLSSTSSDNIYVPSSILNLDRMPDKYWPETCSGHKIKSKTIWLYLEFALKNWKSRLHGRQLNFPLVKNRIIKLWPMRFPETDDNRLYHGFAIGHDTSLETYHLYHAQIRDGIFINLEPCLDFSHEIIHHLQKILLPATDF
ncbi:BgtE-6023 [Blumeria graminis f. sp. tritici]|uniref:BgtE-6023 n=2 Tax=Blumeria graminis f. sp. tritici TaxID=62690 RepID=A0A381LCW1_BLUGR|nr:putative secreted effector protein [Blumeria graminis f. sp. tritici 96224]VCU40691.1 BgtE-6023 [Blumeria graminis f. sp. tritici]